MTVYCDMDGVLADFLGAYDEFFGNKIPSKGFVAISGHEWKRLKTEWPTFWIDLDPLPNAMGLWKEISSYAPSILTAIPVGWPSAATGKAVWVRQHLTKFGYKPSQQLITCLRHEKQQYATTNGEPNVLIDDQDNNVREWQAAGGIAIHYTDSRSMVAKVAKTLESLTK